MNKRICLAVFIAALALRLGLLFGFRAELAAYEQFDARAYEAIAVNLTQGNGFLDASGLPTDSRPPVYPLFLAAAYSLTGHSDLAPRLLQCVLDSSSAVLLMLIAGLLFSPAVAVLSGALVAVYPPFILYSTVKLTESLFMFLLLLECWFLVKAFKYGENKSFAYSGVFHGLGVLVRSPTLLFPAFLLPVILFTGLRKTLLKGFLFYLLISSAIISVWTVRNYRVLNDFLPVNTGSGWLIWFSVQDDAWDGDRLVELSPLREYPELKDLPRSEMEAIVARRVLSRALKDPLWYAGKMARNFARLWTMPVGKVMLSGKSPAGAKLYQAGHYLLLLIALCGLFCLPKGMGAIPPLLYLVYVSVMHSIVLAVPRYRLPFDPILLMLVAGGLVFLYGRLFKKKIPECR